MIPRRIELENFLSFGAPAVEFTFTDEEPLWVLCGQNGVGKSAVFDGITYALYGEHRAGAQKAEQLVRHGANGFRVVFEFEFAGVAYRITRSRDKRTTQKIEQRIDGPWEAIPGINSAGHVKAWVESTLGMGFEAFTTSVLLRQGEADKLFSASRDERIKLLKGIIGFERFEEVSNRVHCETLCRKSALDTLQRQIAGVAPVAPEELAVAEAAVTAAEGAWKEAQAAHTAAALRVEQAKQWQGLEGKRTKLQRQLDEAEKRAAQAARIRADKARLDDLAAAVPELKKLVQLRDESAALTTKMAKAESTRTQVAAELETARRAADRARKWEDQHRQQAEELDRRAKSLGEAIERGAKFLELADAMEAVKRKLAAYPADLADQVAQAETEESAAEEKKRLASGDLSAADALLRQADARRKRFADVKVGVTCSQCGQLVDEAHAAQERARLDHEIQTQQSEVERLRAVVDAAAAAVSAARKRRVSLQRDKSEFDKRAADLAATHASLAKLGATADAVELRARLDAQCNEKRQMEDGAAHERSQQVKAGQDAAGFEKEAKRLDMLLQKATDAVRQFASDLTACRARHDSGWERLAPPWQARFPELDAEAIGELAAEHDRLKASGVAARFELLRQDDQQRAEWSQQLKDVLAEMGDIPADAHVPTPEAERLLREANTAADAANDARTAAVQTRQSLEDRAEQYAQLTAQLRTAEREYDLHQKLDALLGQNGLQRELVRDAEQQIVELANDTLQNLSDGDLTLEPDDEAAGRDDKAFALRVRRAGDPLPIGVLFLSGSQKFRVAVSVALAVGRFASGRARPLEAVIIDEGFGSLDKDGLRAMADELKRLQRSQSLKRVILVSHQEEFTDQFPVGYRLSSGENGTVAAPFRR